MPNQVRQRHPVHLRVGGKRDLDPELRRHLIPKGVHAASGVQLQLRAPVREQRGVPGAVAARRARNSTTRTATVDPAGNPQYAQFMELKISPTWVAAVVFFAGFASKDDVAAVAKGVQDSETRLTAAIEAVGTDIRDLRNHFIRHLERTAPPEREVE